MSEEAVRLLGITESETAELNAATHRTLNELEYEDIDRAKIIGNGETYIKYLLPPIDKSKIEGIQKKFEVGVLNALGNDRGSAFLSVGNYQFQSLFGGFGSMEETVEIYALANEFGEETSKRLVLRQHNSSYDIGTNREYTRLPLRWAHFENQIRSR